jgi:hypothetical protein
MIKKVLRIFIPLLIGSILLFGSYNYLTLSTGELCGKIIEGEVFEYQTTGKYPSWKIVSIVEYKNGDRHFETVTRANLINGEFCARRIDYNMYYSISFIITMAIIAAIVIAFVFAFLDWVYNEK